MYISLEDIIRLLLAMVAGGAIGLEREFSHKAAGFRTITLICIGAALLTMLDLRLTGTIRIAANIVTGIGFLGGGVILRDTTRIKGLTTAATVWISAAVGMVIGSGAYLLGIFAVILVLLMMNLFLRLERMIDTRSDKRSYQLILPNNLEKLDQVESVMCAKGLRITRESHMKRDGRILAAWTAIGNTQSHEAFLKVALSDQEITDIEW